MSHKNAPCPPNDINIKGGFVFVVYVPCVPQKFNSYHQIKKFSELLRLEEQKSCFPHIFAKLYFQKNCYISSKCTTYHLK